MRIVHTFIKYPPAIGGQERYVQELVESLRQRNYDARVITSNLRVHIPPGEVLDRPYSVVHGVPVIRLAAERPLNHRVVLPELRETLLAMKPDLIHAHDIWRDSFLVSIDVARQLGVPLFLNPVYHDRPGESSLQELRAIAERIPDDALIFFNTRYEEECLAALGIRFKNVDYLPPSLDLAEIDSIPRAPALDVPKRLLVTFVGRIHAVKRVHLLIRAFAAALRQLEANGDGRADRTHLVIAGHRDSDIDPAGIAASCGIRDRVSVRLDCSRDEIVNLLRSSSILALPSAAETFGIVVIEGWATENLVLVADKTALPYVVRHEHNGIVCSDDEWPDRLVQAIRGVDTPWGQALIRNGRATVSCEHSRQNRIDYLVRCIEAAVAFPKASGL